MKKMIETVCLLRFVILVLHIRLELAIKRSDFLHEGETCLQVSSNDIPINEENAFT